MKIEESKHVSAILNEPQHFIQSKHILSMSFEKTSLEFVMRSYLRKLVHTFGKIEVNFSRIFSKYKSDDAATC